MNNIFLDSVTEFMDMFGYVGKKASNNKGVEFLVGNKTLGAFAVNGLNWFELSFENITCVFGTSEIQYKDFSIVIGNEECIIKL